MPFTLDEILKYADPLVTVVTSTSQNTLNPERDFSDMLGGPEGHDGMDTSASYESDEVLYISDGNVPGLNTRRLLTPNNQVTNSLPPPYSGKGGSSTVSTFRIENDAATLPLDRKMFDGTPYTLKVGGTMFPGEANEEVLTWGDYQIWSSGRLTSFDIDTEISLSAARLPNDLLNQFPSNYHEHGQSRGLAKDYLVGSHRSHRPKLVDDGIFDFHDGPISDTDDIELGFYPFSGLETGELFGDISLDGGLSSGASYDQNNFSWTNVNSKKVTSSVPAGGVDISVNSNMQLETIDGTSVRGRQEVDIETYGHTMFYWRKVGAKELQGKGSVSATVTVEGDAILRDEHSYWFKLNGPNTTGSKVRIQFDRKVVGMRLMARSVNQVGPVTVDNFNGTVASVEPAFAHHTNSLITLTDINEDYVEFDYKGNGIFPSGGLTAFWIVGVDLAVNKKSTISFDFNNTQKSLALQIDASAGEKVLNWSVQPVLTGDSIGAGTTIATWSNFNSDNLDIEWSTSPGSMVMTVTEMTQASGDYGAVFEEGIIKLSPADGSEAKVIMRMIDPDTGDDTTLDRHLSFRARVVGRDSLSLYWGYEYNPGIGQLNIEITKQWQDYSFNEVFGKHGSDGALGGSFAQDGLYLNADRDFVDGLADYTVEISAISDMVARLDEQEEYFAEHVQVLDPKGDGVTFFPTFKVPDVKAMGKLPKQLALYDSNGFVKVSPAFTSIEGLFHGILSVKYGTAPDLSNSPLDVAVDPTGRLYFGGSFTTVDGKPRERFARATSDGVFDSTFGNELTTDGLVRQIETDSQGRVYAVFSSSTIFGQTVPASPSINNTIARFLDDGTIDTAFDIGGGFSSQGPQGFRILDDDRLLIYGGGLYDSNAGTSFSVILDDEGTLDGTFSSTLSTSYIDSEELSDGRFIFVSATGSDMIYADGTQDLGYTGFVPTFGTMQDTAILSDDRVIITGSDGTTGAVHLIDSSGVEQALFASTFSTDHVVTAVVVDDDDNVFMFGTFDEATDDSGTYKRHGVLKLTISELGYPSIDKTFGEGDGFLAVGQTEVGTGSGPRIAKIIGNDIFVGGLFSRYQGIDRNRLVRIVNVVAGNIYKSPVAEVLSRISLLATGEDYIAQGAPDVMSVSVPFTTRKPVIDWIDEISSGADMIYEVDSETGTLELNQRYSGDANPEEFRIYERQMVKDSNGQVIRRVRSTPPETGYVVSYFDSSSGLTAPIDQATGTVKTAADIKPKEIFSYVTEEEDAQYLANRDARDIHGQSEYTFTLSGLGHGLRTGMVGYVYTAKTNGYDAEIVEANEQRETGNTVVTINLYDVKRGNLNDF